MSDTILKHLKNINYIFIIAIIFFLAIVFKSSYAIAAGSLEEGATCSSSDQCKSGLTCTNEKCQSSIDNNKFSQVMCRVLDIASGTGGKAFAAFAIISVGIGFFTGKVSWGLMIGVAAGIAIIFGAPSIVAAISGDTEVDCSAIAASS